jgi:hypothetical protein
MIENLIQMNLAKDRGITLVERQKIEHILKEQYFSLTGIVSEEAAQRIGRLLGADTVIYGSLEQGSMGIKNRMIVTATVTESGKILQQRTYNVQIEHNPHFWTLGVSAGSSFFRPLLTGTIHGTIAPFRYSFLELGVDLGLFADDLKVLRYFSMHPFVRYALFLPLGKGGWYAGAGAGYWYREQTISGILMPVRVENVESFTFDITAGFNLWNMLNILYTLQTNLPAKEQHILSVGYTYRF